MLYEILRPDEHAWVSNRRGPLGFPTRLPIGHAFRSAIERHRFEYWRGFSELDRKTADKRCLGTMLVAAKIFSNGRVARWLLICFAWRYFVTSRWFGRKVFRYRNRYASRQELDSEMAVSE